MSVFELKTLPSIARLSARTADDPPGTEAVVEPINSLVAAVENSDGSISAISAITSATLENNSNLGTVDLEILGAVTNFVNSSAAEWNAYSDAGGFGADSLWYGEWNWGGGGGPVCDQAQNCEPMSIFLLPGWARKALFIVGSDAIGCGTGALATWWSGAAGAGASCVIWGVGTSAVGALGVALL